jgi:hypothetical protein
MPLYVWKWHTALIPALGRRNQENLDLKASLDSTVKHVAKPHQKSQVWWFIPVIPEIRKVMV